MEIESVGYGYLQGRANGAQPSKIMESSSKQEITMQADQPVFRRLHSANSNV